MVFSDEGLLRMAEMKGRIEEEVNLTFSYPIEVNVMRRREAVSYIRRAG